MPASCSLLAFSLLSTRNREENKLKPSYVVQSHLLLDSRIVSSSYAVVLDDFFRLTRRPVEDKTVFGVAPACERAAKLDPLAARSPAKKGVRESRDLQV